jgi:hypothetical protein
VWATRFAWQKTSLYKIEGVREDIVDGTGKISRCNGGLHGVPLPGGQKKKIGQRGGTPRGRRHAPTLVNQLIPAVEGEIKRARVGGGCITILRGGEVKATYFLGVHKKLQVTWNLTLYFFWTHD